MRHSFISTQPVEYFDVDTVARILQCLPQRVLELVQDGKLRARTVNGEMRVDSASLDKLIASRTLPPSRPAPPTYVKTLHGVRLER